jgi:hypothetical protein
VGWIIEDIIERVHVEFLEPAEIEAAYRPHLPPELIEINAVQCNIHEGRPMSMSGKIWLCFLASVVGATMQAGNVQAQQVPIPQTAAEVPGPTLGPLTKEYVQMVAGLAGVLTIETSPSFQLLWKRMPSTSASIVLVLEGKRAEGRSTTRSPSCGGC